MENIINTMLTEDEKVEFQKHTSFIPQLIDTDALKSMTIAKTAAGRGLLVATDSALHFAVSHFGSVAQQTKIQFKDVDQVKFDGRSLTVRRKKGLFKNQEFEILSASPENFVEVLTEHFDVQVAEDGDRKYSESDIALRLENIQNEAEIFDVSTAGRDFKALPEVLEEGECVYAVVSGMYERNIGVVAITDRRVVFLDKGLINLTVEVFYFTNLSSVRYHTGMALGEIILLTYGNEEKISSIANNQIQPLVSLINRQIHKSQQPNQEIPAVPQSVSVHSLADEIMKLAELKDKGIISDEEFDQLKAKVIQD